MSKYTRTQNGKKCYNHFDSSLHGLTNSTSIQVYLLSLNNKTRRGKNTLNNVYKYLIQGLVYPGKSQLMTASLNLLLRRQQ